MAIPNAQAASPPSFHSRRELQILRPFDRHETMTVAEFAAISGVSVPSAREVVSVQGLGRKLGGRWLVSKIAAAMYLDGDREALKAYWSGDRTSDRVRSYFERFGIDPAALGRGV